MAIPSSSLGWCDRPFSPVCVCGRGPDVYTAIIFGCCTPDRVTKGYFCKTLVDIYQWGYSNVLCDPLLNGCRSSVKNEPLLICLPHTPALFQDITNCERCLGKWRWGQWSIPIGPCVSGSVLHYLALYYYLDCNKIEAFIHTSFKLPGNTLLLTKKNLRRIWCLFMLFCF